jgi:hypothetical protein
MMNRAIQPVRHGFSNFRQSLEPGADITVWTKAGTNDGSNVYWGRNHAVWNNRGGDAAVLLDPQGAQIARYAW